MKFIIKFYLSHLDVVIPTSSADKQNIILKEGQKVMVLKSPKGIYMQLETGKIIAIRTALKVGHNKDKTQQDTPFMAREMQKRGSSAIGTTNKVASVTPAVAATQATTGAATATAIGNISNSGNTTGTFTPTNTKTTVNTARRGANHVQFGRTNSMAGNKTVQMGTAKPYNMKSNARTPMTTTTPDNPTSTMLQGQYPMSNSNSSFDADISDDSQFLEKLGENLANQQNTDDDNDDGTKQMNKLKENKSAEQPMMPGISMEQQNQQHHQLQQPQQQTTMMKNQAQNIPIMQSHHMSKLNNNGLVSGNVGGGDTSNMSHTQVSNKPEQMNRPFRNSNSNGSIGNTDNYNSNMNNGSSFGGSTATVPAQPPPPPAAAASSIPNYTYNYNATQNSSYNEVQSTPSATGQGPSSQEMMHPSNVMNQSRQPDKYSAATQHVR